MIALDCVRVGDDILVPSVDAAKFCIRCGEPTHPTDAPHLCDDIVAGIKEDTDQGWREYSRFIVVYGGEA